ncbi:hypothetical protein QSJ18_13425 [Gordonia sp. ABSL1-1]|uniref:hypothetical protein n=1 Tax=Gordonia sp. ABSL1-1 TaxID=3053923 RepID=UPI002572DFD9|nr:hypothetical protein [Gordonia sp. ABSL1-1]MDL9937748.1 hypothetical protein [Gordonia sp. ABSL1-1]
MGDGNFNFEDLRSDEGLKLFLSDVVAQRVQDSATAITQFMEKGTAGRTLEFTDSLGDIKDGKFAKDTFNAKKQPVDTALGEQLARVRNVQLMMDNAIKRTNAADRNGRR